MAQPTRLRLKAPGDFDLAQAICSYGYFLLAPNRWRPAEQVYERRFQPTELGLESEDHFTIRVSQTDGRGGVLGVRCDRSLTAAERAAVRAALARTARIEDDLTAWYRRSAVAKRRGFGRLFPLADVI